jgi:hypothetical protein
LINGITEGYVFVNLDDVKISEIRNGSDAGRSMAYLTVSDESGTLSDIMAFANTYEEFGSLLICGSMVSLKLKRSKKGDCYLIQDVLPLEDDDEQGTFLGECDERPGSEECFGYV